MTANKQKIVVKENKNNDAARFFISYSPNRSSEVNRETSFEILSSLIKDNDIIMEFDSSLTTLPTPKEREASGLGMVRDLRELGIEYRYQKSESSSGRGFLGLFNFGKSSSVHKILAYIPNKTWKEDDLLFMLPTCGVRYYICKDQADGGKILEDMYCGKIMDAEKIDLFNFIIYDCSDFGQMGVNTKISKEELQKALSV